MEGEVKWERRGKKGEMVVGEGKGEGIRGRLGTENRTGGEEKDDGVVG